MTRWFGDRPVRLEPVGTPGYSGSTVMRLEVPPGGAPFILKSFPEAIGAARARWVQRLVAHLRSEGCMVVPEVIATRDRVGLVEDEAGRLWEVMRSMPGEPVPAPSVAQARAAARCLAEIHVAAARMPGEAMREGVPAAFSRRHTQARDLLASPWRDVLAAKNRPAAPVAARLGGRFAACVEAFESCGAERLLAAWVGMDTPRVPLQPCLRDVWHEHVFFATRESDTVTAVIDLHAAAIDTPATDLARLLGSWIPPADRATRPLSERCREAIAAYEDVRELEPTERRLVPLLHATGVVLGLDHWLRWTWADGRLFADLDRACSRIDALLAELPVAVSTVRDAGDLDV